MERDMKNLRRLLLTFAIALMALLQADIVFAAVKIPAIMPGETLQTVKTLAWKATLRRTVKTKYGRFKAGTTVTVIKGGSKCIISLGGHNYKIASKYLSFGQDLASIVTDGDYNTSTKISYANSTKRTSKTSYLVWVSLDKQRINVYKGSSGNWKLVKVFKCTTGANNSTPIGTFTIRKKMHSYTGQYGSPLYFYMEFAGSGFHRWPGSGVGTIGTHPQSHGCIRMRQSDAIWMYKNVPLKTKVIIY